VSVVVGSGIAAQRLSPSQTGLQLLENSIATALGLAVLILVFGPLSGAHFNPAVSLADWLLGRRAGTGSALPELAGYLVAQAAGALAGSVLANLMYGLPAVQVSGHHRAGDGTLLGEVVAHPAARNTSLPAPASSTTPTEDPMSQPTSAHQPAPVSDPGTSRRPSVLFVCVHNAGRSQMAAGWLTALAAGAIEVRSAGTTPPTRSTRSRSRRWPRSASTSPPPPRRS
jgi:hypothetical protein